MSFVLQHWNKESFFVNTKFVFLCFLPNSTKAFGVYTCLVIQSSFFRAFYPAIPRVLECIHA